MQALIDNNDFILMEAAVVEQLRRSSNVTLHPSLVNAPLIYEAHERQTMKAIYREYLQISLRHRLPFVMCTPTWRANEERVKNADVPLSINIDAVQFMKEIRDEIPDEDREFIRIGGMIGCWNDCYLPAQALTEEQATRTHRWQIEALVRGGVDFLIAETLPEVNEALGIAQAMSASGVPYIISFVIDRHGKILDGSTLDEAIATIDAATTHKPLGFMVNCAYPTFLCPETQPARVFDRLIGYQANASSLDHCQLEQAEHLQTEDVSDWGAAMLTLNRRYGIKILGGCCGTGPEHLVYLTEEYCR